MRTWLDHLTATLDSPSETDRAAAKEAKRRARHRLRFVPMEERLTKLLAELPADERNAPRPISFFRQGLKSKYPSRGEGRASVAEIGPALRRLGWRRERQWRNPESGFNTVWVPPTTGE